jgi:hypothetical protein
MSQFIASFLYPRQNLKETINKCHLLIDFAAVYFRPCHSDGGGPHILVFKTASRSCTLLLLSGIYCVHSFGQGTSLVIHANWDSFNPLPLPSSVITKVPSRVLEIPNITRERSILLFGITLFGTAFLTVARRLPCSRHRKHRGFINQTSQQSRSYKMG